MAQQRQCTVTLNGQHRANMFCLRHPGIRGFRHPHRHPLQYSCMLFRLQPCSAPAFFQLLQPLQPFNFLILSISARSTVRRRSLVRPEKRIFSSAGTETPRIDFLFSKLYQIINRPWQYGAIISKITLLTVYVEHHGAPCRRRAPICCRLAGDIGLGQWHRAEVCLSPSIKLHW